MLGNAIISFTINHHLNERLPEDPFRGLTQVSMTGFVPNFIVVHAYLLAHRIAEVVERNRRKPPAISPPDPGTISPLRGDAPKAGVGITMTARRKGDIRVLPDVIGSQVHVRTRSLSVMLPHVPMGELRPIAATTAQRAVLLPEVYIPDVEEFKYIDIRV
ncbi:MAG: hypothetical protein IPP88_13745 [Betaproteobacteria bacterium]|nr:hypothetical protein [Betaproteobacteria bacterium]